MLISADNAQKVKVVLPPLLTRKAAEVVYMMGKGNGGFSGGTIISLLDAFFAEPKEEVEACAHPYVLVPPGYPHGADNPDCWCVFFWPGQS